MQILKACQITKVSYVKEKNILCNNLGWSVSGVGGSFGGLSGEPKTLLKWKRQYAIKRKKNTDFRAMCQNPSRAEKTEKLKKKETKPEKKPTVQLFFKSSNMVQLI